VLRSWVVATILVMRLLAKIFLDNCKIVALPFWHLLDQYLLLLLFSFSSVKIKIS
jgi:hypothetical protein